MVEVVVVMGFVLFVVLMDIRLVLTTMIVVVVVVAAMIRPLVLWLPRDML